MEHYNEAQLIALGISEDLNQLNKKHAEILGISPITIDGNGAERLTSAVSRVIDDNISLSTLILDYIKKPFNTFHRKDLAFRRENNPIYYVDGGGIFISSRDNLSHFIFLDHIKKDRIGKIFDKFIDKSILVNEYNNFSQNELSKCIFIFWTDYSNSMVVLENINNYIEKDYIKNIFNVIINNDLFLDRDDEFIQDKLKISVFHFVRNNVNRLIINKIVNSFLGQERLLPASHTSNLVRASVKSRQSERHGRTVYLKPRPSSHISVGAASMMTEDMANIIMEHMVSRAARVLAKIRIAEKGDRAVYIRPRPDHIKLRFGKKDAK